MTAPAAPYIYGRQNGHDIYVRWRPVLNATDYKVYVGDAPSPTGLEADVPDDDIETDGWFFYIVSNEVGVTYVNVTALNVGAEESSPSNELQVNLRGDGHMVEPTPALNVHRKWGGRR